jgi:hypothetical protein
MPHPDIEVWLHSRAEVARLSELECKAAEAWFDSLSLEQRKVFAELLLGSEGLSHLRQRVMRAHFEAERRRRGER